MADYNGWTNKDTWLVNVWFGDYFTEIVESEERSLDADELENLVMETAPEGITGFWSDVVGMLDVDYDELTEHFIFEGEEENDD